MDKKIAIITGANAGIGNAATKQLVVKGVHVVMACRHELRAQKALEEVKKETGLDNVEVMLLDLSSQKSIHTFSQTFKEKYNKLDILINNAGSFNIAQKKAFITEDGFESLWATNYLGPFLLTHLLLDLMEGNKGRIINISSKGLIVYPFMKINYDRFNGNYQKFSVQKEYYQSKLALVMFTYKLAKKLEDSDVHVNNIRVPSVKIPEERFIAWGVPTWQRKIVLMKTRSAMTPEKMAESYISLATDTKYANLNGMYLNEKLKPVGSNRYSRKVENWDKLWEKSQIMTKLA